MIALKWERSATVNSVSLKSVATLNQSDAKRQITKLTTLLKKCGVKPSDVMNVSRKTNGGMYWSPNQDEFVFNRDRVKQLDYTFELVFEGELQNDGLMIAMQHFI